MFLKDKKVQKKSSKNALIESLKTIVVTLKCIMVNVEEI